MVSHRKMIAALVLGAGLGIVANLIGGGTPWLDALVRNVAQPIGQLFIRLLFMLVIPGIPVEGLGLIIGVDRFLDMCRTTVNVIGDLAAAVYVARGEPAGSSTLPSAARSAS